MSRVFAFVTVLLLALAFLPAQDAPARAGGGEQYGDGGSSGSGSNGGGSGDGGGRSGGGGGGGGASLPGVLGIVVGLWFLFSASPPLGVAIVAGSALLLYLGYKLETKLRRARRRRQQAQYAADEGPQWPKKHKALTTKRPKQITMHAEAVVAAAVAAMLSDGKIAEAECALLQRLAERHGVSREALDRLVHSLEMGALPAAEVTRGVPRAELLAVVRDVIAADGVADPKELELADALARKLA